VGRGGYQKPSNPSAGPSGPGKFSKRTDGGASNPTGGQAIRVPNVGDSPDLQYGDRTRLEDAQRIAKANQAPPVGGSAQGVTGTPRTGETLPPWLTGGDSNRPGEPVTAGLDMGAGPGSEALTYQAQPMDEREAILQALYAIYGNPDALKDLQTMRAEKMQAAIPPVAPSFAGPAAAPPENAAAPPPGSEAPSG
jgi:hypothetical protein